MDAVRGWFDRSGKSSAKVADRLHPPASIRLVAGWKRVTGRRVRGQPYLATNARPWPVWSPLPRYQPATPARRVTAFKSARVLRAIRSRLRFLVQDALTSKSAISSTAGESFDLRSSSSTSAGVTWDRNGLQRGFGSRRPEGLQPTGRNDME